jgi:hypothetical protein
MWRRASYAPDLGPAKRLAKRLCLIEEIKHKHPHIKLHYPQLLTLVLGLGLGMRAAHMLKGGRRSQGIKFKHGKEGQQ